MIFAECRECPANTVTRDSGLAVCPCAEGYYRAEGDDDLPCTRELKLGTGLALLAQRVSAVQGYLFVWLIIFTQGIMAEDIMLHSMRSYQYC